MSFDRIPPQRALLAAFTVAAALCSAPALAGQSVSSHQHAAAELASLRLERDPFARVYIVTSRATHEAHLATITRNGITRRDSTGAPLIVSEIRAHQLSVVSERIHQRELRCGGYFAFRTRAEAEAFVRNDKSARAIRTLLVDYTIDNQATVSPWLSQVSESNLYNTINHLQGYQNRYYTSSTGRTSAEWIRDTWQALAAGRSDVSTELFNCSDCSTQPSVILTIQGTELPDEIVVLGGHLDSIISGGGGSDTQRAPGADDDASGIASLTEVIRVALASGWQPRRTVKFMGYAAEEVGLRGSNAIASSFSSSGKNVVGVLQLDMTNYKSGAVDDMQLITDYSNASLKTFLTELFDEYLAPMGLTRSTYTCGYGCSDHASWTSAGYPAAMMFEAGDPGGYNPNIHTPDDTLASMGETAEHSVKFAQLGLAFLGELAKTDDGTPNEAPTAGFSASVDGLLASFIDSSSDSDGVIASRSWDFGDGNSSTETSPSHVYASGGTYSVTLTVTDNEGTTDTETKAVTASGGGVDDRRLQNGITRPGIGGIFRTSERFTLQVPSGSSNLRFVTSGGIGNTDLYVKLGSPPTGGSHDCRSANSGNAETCTIASPQAGTYHVLLHARSGALGVSLTGSFQQTYGNDANFDVDDNATAESQIAVSNRYGNVLGNAQVGVRIVHTYIGDLKVDLVAPDGSVYVLHNRSGGSADDIDATYAVDLTSETLNGTWKFKVNDNADGDTGYIDGWSLTF